MSNVFLSHRKVDAAESRRLAADITAAGHDVWLDEWAIDIGDSIVSRVQEGLVGASYLVLCCSASGTSDWVDREWMSALARQLGQHDIKVLPVLLTGGKLPAILADVKFADLVADWSAGVAALLRAIH
jgi:hypothetical protein